MAGKSAAPGPAEPKVANSRRQRRKPEHGSETTVNYRKTEKDVDKLIHCLAEWTEDMRTARCATPEAPVRRKQSPVPRAKGCSYRVTGAVLSAGESSYPIDGIQGSGRRGLVGVRRGHSSGSAAAHGDAPPFYRNATSASTR